MKKIHFISSGHLGNENQYYGIIDELKNSRYDEQNHIHLGNVSNHMIFKKVIDYIKQVNENDTLLIQWNSPKIFEAVHFINNIPKISTNIKNSLDSYTSFHRDKIKFYLHEQILLFDLIHSFLKSKDKVNIKELFNHKIPFIAVTNPIYFTSKEISFYDYILSNDLIDIKTGLFRDHYIDHIKNDLLNYL